MSAVMRSNAACCDVVMSLHQAHYGMIDNDHRIYIHVTDSNLKKSNSAHCTQVLRFPEIKISTLQ